MQKESFRAAKDHLLQAKRRSFGKPRKTALCNGSSLPPKNAAMISAEISDGKKPEQHKPRQHLPAATKRNTAGEKGGSTDEKAPRQEYAPERQKNAAGGKTMRQNSRKTRHPQRHAAHI